MSGPPVVGGHEMERLALLQQLQRLLGRDQAVLQREPNSFDVGLPQPSPQRCASQFGDEIIEAAHDARPRKSPHRSSTASARSTPSATAVKAPAASSAAMVASCLSVARPPSALSSS